MWPVFMTGHMTISDISPNQNQALNHQRSVILCPSLFQFEAT